MIIGQIARWVELHPARAGTIAGWYQQGASAVAALIAVPQVLKQLGDADAGLWFAFQGVLAILTLTDFGLSFVVARQVAFSLKAQGQSTEMSDLIPTRLGWVGISDVYEACRRLFRWVSLAVLVLLVLFYHAILPQGKLAESLSAHTVPVWYLLGAATLLLLQAKPHLALLDGVAKLYLGRSLTGTYQLCAGFGALAALLSGGGMIGMAAIVAACAALHYVGARWLVWREAGSRLTASAPLPPGLMRHLIRVAAPLGLLNASAFLVSSVQVPLLGTLLGAKAVPAFYLAQKIGQTLNLAVMQLVYPQLPLFTQELAAGETARARRRMRRAILAVTAVGAAVSLIFYYGSPLFVEAWVGPKRYVSTGVLALMALDYLLMTAAVVWAQFVLAGGQNPFFVTTLASGVLNVCLCVSLLPRIGMIGVPIASLATGLCINYWFVSLKGWNLFKLLKPLRESGRSG